MGDGDDYGLDLITPADRAELQRLIMEAGEVAEDAVAPATRRARASDWRAFESWCGQRGVPSLPAPPAVLAAYLTAHGSPGEDGSEPTHKVSTLARWVASVNAQHDRAGLVAPGRNPGVQAVLRGLRRRQGVRPSRVSPLLVDDVRLIVESMDFRSWPGGVAATRDAALIVVGFAGAFRRSELAALTVEDFTLSPKGMLALVKRSKTDQDGEGRFKSLPWGVNPQTCPPCMVWRWLTVAGAGEGSGRGRGMVMKVLAGLPPVTVHVCRDWHGEGGTERVIPEGAAPFLRPVSRHGAISATPMTGEAVREVVQRRVQMIGLDPNRFGGHSLRAGFVTEALRRGEDSMRVRQQTHHTSDRMLEVYFREQTAHVNNAVNALGL